MERKKKYYSAITRRLLIAFFCLSILPILIFAWIMKDTVEATNVIKLRELATSTIEHRTEVISVFLNDKISLLSMMVSFYPREFFFDQQNLDNLYLAMGSRGSDIVDLQVIDAAGVQHGYVGPYRAMVKDKKYSDAQWFQETLISGVHVSDVFTGFRNVPHFVVAVTDSLKSFVLRATINSSSFNSLLHSAQLGPHSDAFIINRAGQFQTPSLLNRTELDANEKKLISFDNKSQAVITDTNIYKTRWIGNGQWLLVLKANLADSMDFYLTLRNRVFIIVGMIILLSLSAAVTISIALSRNLERADKEHAANSMQFAHVEKMATIGRLAAGIAHEINNPLQMITSQAGWISELLPDEDPAAVKNMAEYKNAVDKIRHHVKRAGTITHRLLGFSKKMTAQQDRVHINELMTETLSFVEREAENNSISIMRNFSPGLPATMTDGPQLQQVFLNLINNALDAVGPKGVVEITTSISGDGRLVIECADNGPGIRPENLKQIFDPFFTTKDPDKGTGLGLYISYDIIKKLGGTISVENRKDGGALFRVILPVKSYGNQQ
ncbi:MAG: ATP-binding protein [Desulforhopalus sp.]